ncbi:MAG: hypothetical protein ACREFX_10440 [Opitutaceae bacterium]
MGILGTLDPFSTFGGSAEAKLIFLGPPDTRWDRFRSLPIEHVSPVALRREISHGDDLARLRRWFFGRKPDAGFLITGFPATLLQSRILDEWLDARHEGLDAVFAGPAAPEALVNHYREQGLFEPFESPARTRA